MDHSRNLLLLVALFLTVRTAQAESPDAKTRKARKACLSGDYMKGVSILSELFVDTQDSNYIYNQGRCFEQNLHYREAIGRFQEYLRVANKLRKTERAEAEKHIADCKELLATQLSQPPVEVPTPAPAAPSTPAPAAASIPAPAAASTPVALVLAAPLPAAAPLTAMAQSPVAQETNPQLEGKSGSSLRTAGVVTAAIGGAGLVSGLIFNLKFNGLTSDMQKLDGYTAGRASDRNTYRTLVWTSYGVGAACVATGAILYYLGVRREPSSSVAFMPALVPGQVGALLKGSF